MPQNLLENMPFLIKLLALLLGGIIALVLSGDIKIDDNDNANLKINGKVIIKLLCSIGLGLFLGEWTIDYWEFEHLNYYAQSAVLMMFSVFGMLIFGIVYRSIQLTLHEKTLSEIIIEVKNVVRAFLK
ncbi:hypothetical protein [Moraxella equi]|uniref:Uncharacterized protein n=1 Tax=Moraxella equi TaxID=60442 RepID=A0A378QMB3_9GAMM|nr:hypothetical protein [Moraxella equi]OPH36054.1 hypothetical protein B5J93_09900 [Moraxella equi]STZ02047.1 Uncharacterised protein [Moraxella equi]